ncbi:MAG: hypothetical protein ABIS84_01140, partial [Arachnia sp.]
RSSVGLVLDDKWVWDSWPVDDQQGRHHLFYLQADRALVDPHLRHMNASVGHAASDDFRTWEVLPDAMAARATPGWDDRTIGTGSVVRGGTGRYHLFYTGASASEGGMIQRIGRADSDDLLHWERFGADPVLQADARWYEKWDGTNWHDEAFRDPWVMRDPAGHGWHMLMTARCRDGDMFSRGVIGHAWSADLDVWEPRPPLSGPGKFGQLEGLQYAELGGVPHMVFSCDEDELHPDLHIEGQPGGVWLVPGEGLLGPWNLNSARRVDHESLYAARVVNDIDGSQRLLGFSDVADGEFVGGILDPVEIELES